MNYVLPALSVSARSKNTQVWRWWRDYWWKRKQQRKENCMHEICTCIKARNTSDFRLCYVTCEQTIEPLPSFILYQWYVCTAWSLMFCCRENNMRQLAALNISSCSRQPPINSGYIPMSYVPYFSKRNVKKWRKIYRNISCMWRAFTIICIMIQGSVRGRVGSKHSGRTVL